MAGENTDTTTNLIAMQTENDSLRIELQTTTKELETLRKDYANRITQLLNENEKLKKENNHLIDKNDEQGNQIIQLQNEKKLLHDKLIENANQIQKYEYARKTLMDESSLFKARIIELESTNTMQSFELQTTNKELAINQKRLSELQIVKTKVPTSRNVSRSSLLGWIPYIWSG